MTGDGGPLPGFSSTPRGAQVRHRGWLDKRGPVASFGWRRVWAVLKGRILVFYEDDCARIKKGDFVLGPYTSPLPFSSAKVRDLSGASAARPPPDKQELAARPFGFAVQPASDAPPPPGAHCADALWPPALYLDALGPEEFRLWMQAMSDAACEQRQEPAAEGAADSDMSSGEYEWSMSEGEIFEVTAGEDVDRIGVAVLTLPPSEVLVKRVQPGLWAEKVGILPHDIILAVNGVSVHVMTEDEFKEALQYRPVTLRVSGFEEREMCASSAPCPTRPGLARTNTVMQA